MNKKQTLITAITTTIVGLTVGASTAGVRYFKKDGNRERFFQNETIQKVRKTTNQVAEQIKNGQIKIQTFVTNFKNELEEADKNAEKQEITVVNEQAEAPAAQAKPTAKVEEIKTIQSSSDFKETKQNQKKQA